MGLLSVFELVRRLSAPDGPRTSGLRILQLGLALALGFGLSSFFSLPIREYAQESIRASGAGGGVTYEYATGWSLRPIETLTFLVPGALGFGGATYWGSMPFTDFPNYMGLAILLCAFLAIAAGRRRFEAAYLLVLAMFALLVALGKHSAVYNFLFEHMPYFNKFRVPVMILILLQLAVAVLAGLGLTAVAEAVQDPARRTRMLRWTGVLLVVTAILFVSGLLGDAWRDSYTRAALASRPQMDPSAIDVGYRSFVADLVRVTLLALVGVGALFATLRGWVKPAVAIGIVGRGHAVRSPAGRHAPDEGRDRPAGRADRGGERDEVIDFLVAQKQPRRVPHLPGARVPGQPLRRLRAREPGRLPRGEAEALPVLPRRRRARLSSRRSRGGCSTCSTSSTRAPAAVVRADRGVPRTPGRRLRVRGALPRATLVPAFRIVPHEQQMRPTATRRPIRRT
jgi:hypothetical protein